ncbi:MAG: transporter substrate-binding domain-containing protein [Fibromonadales bacterium]|nr:transporter substrate-binding domain-containing protein [Fibromonadales bacterium]
MRLLLFIFILSVCGYANAPYHSIPGVTNEEIEAIEELKYSRQSLSLGSMLTTETFVQPDGTYSGFNVMFCELLSELFDIPFALTTHSWDEIIDGINNKTINFTNEMTPTQERMQTYFMTSPTITRSLSVFSKEGGAAIKTPDDLNDLKIGFLESTITEQSIHKAYPDLHFTTIEVSNIEQAAKMLLANDIDAFIDEEPSKYEFRSYSNITGANIFPLVYTPISLATVHTDLKPIISVMNKYLASGGIDRLSELYKIGRREYAKYELQNVFTEEEKAYMGKLASDKAKIPIALEHDYYPVCFYNERYDEFQGIVPDMLREITMLTGIEFNVMTDKDTPWHKILELLDSGKVSFVSALLFTPERKDKYLWSEPYYTSHYTLLSKIDYPLLDMPQVVRARVSVNKGTAYEEMYKSWFPNYSNLKYYNSNIEAMAALERGEVDLVMASENALMTMTNFLEKPEFKINIRFNAKEESYLGFNLNEKILASIIRKTQKHIETEKINNYWTSRMFNYSKKIAEKRTFYFVIFSITLTILLIILAILLIKNKKAHDLNKIHQRSIAAMYERTRTMLDTIPMACFIGSSSEIIIDCNKEIIKLFGLKDKQEFIERFRNELSPEYQPDGRSSTESIADHTRKTLEKGRYTFEWLHQLPDGTPIPAIVTLEVVDYGEGKTLMAYVRDMREHTKMVHEIARQNDLLETVNRVSSVLLEPDIGCFDDTLRKAMGILAEVAEVDGICIWRNSSNDLRLRFSLSHEWQDGKFSTRKNNGDLAPDIWFNEHPIWNEELSQGICLNSLVRNMPLTEQAELTPRNIKSLFVVPIFLQDLFWGLVGFHHCKAEKTFKNGTTLILRSASRMLTNAIIRHEMAEDLITAKEQAEQSNRAKTAFLAKMSHEIRTPMNAITGMAELALRKDISNTVREEVTTIKRAGANLLSIINDILDLSKVESGKLEIIPKDYRFSSLINDVTSIIKAKLVNSKIQFDLKIDKNIPNVLFGDETRIRQIFLNVLGNAVKFTNEGSILFLINGEITEDTVVITADITDSGKGIREEDIQKLFGDFVQVDLTSNREVEGTGLGLSITKNLVEAMGGSISVKSEYGKGSTFIITLPQKIRSYEPMKMSENQEDASDFTVRFNAPKARLLVVDDIETNLKVAEGLLSYYKVQLDLCLSGQKAIGKIDSDNPYDLIFMDHMMPEMDGVETTRLIREKGYELPIIALTANAVSGTKEMFLSNGFNDFLSKPIDIAKLNAILEKWIPKEKQEEAKGEFKNEISLQTLAVFHKDGIAKIEEIKKCLETEDYKLYVIYVHALKSALANIGAKELSKTAAKLEKGDIEFIKAHTANFLKNLKQLLNNISIRLEKRQEEKTLNMEALAELKAALKTLNPHAINKAVANLQNCAQADGILQNVLIGNYDEALDEIDKILYS